MKGQLARSMIRASVLLVLLSAPAWSEEPLPLARLDGPIKIDGRVDEAAWERIPVLALTQHAPQYRAAPSQRTEIRVAYDDEFVYFGGRMYDSEPQGVRARTLYRDAFAGDDLVCILLDTYDDRESAVWFCVNPAGSRIDQIISDDGATLNIDWNTYWAAEASRDETGWQAEMRIPFSSLGFQDVEGRVLMGLEVYRFIGRTNERLLYPDIPPTAGYFVKPSLFQPIVLEGLHRRPPVYVTPYALAGWQRTVLPDASQAGFGAEHDHKLEAGLDVRYSPSANLSLDATVNTDFAQVEADDLQVNLTRFPLFFPEKRQFFQERSSIFDFGLGGSYSRLFHSRRIGLVEGQPIRLFGGVRAVGRIGGTDFGVLDMQTEAALGRPSENFGVARVRRRVFNDYSTLGAMVTTRIGADGSHNVAVGVDAVVRVVGDEYATLKLAHTSDSAISDASLWDASRVLFRWERRSEGGVSYAGEIGRSGESFAPGVGFDLRSDFTSFDGQLQYLWFMGPESPFRTLSVDGSGQAFHRNADGSTESALIAPSLRGELKNGSTLSLTYRESYEGVLENFPLGPNVEVLPGEYWFREGEAQYASGRTAAFQPSLAVTVGQFYDGHRVAFTASPAWNPSPHLELGVNYDFNAIRFPDRDLTLDVHLAQLRVRAAYDVHLSLSALLQYNSIEDIFAVNARLRYNFRDGSDLWIVYNETLNTDRLARTPIPPLSQLRALTAKYTYTFDW